MMEPGVEASGMGVWPSSSFYTSSAVEDRTEKTSPGVSVSCDSPEVRLSRMARASVRFRRLLVSLTIPMVSRGERASAFKLPTMERLCSTVALSGLN